MFRVMISGRAMANLSYKLNQATPTDSALSLINILDILEDFYRYESFSIMTSNDPKAPWFGVEWPRVTSRSTFHFGILFAQVSKFSDFDLKWPQLPPYLGSGQRSVSGTTNGTGTEFLLRARDRNRKFSGPVFRSRAELWVRWPREPFFRNHRLGSGLGLFLFEFQKTYQKETIFAHMLQKIGDETNFYCFF